MAQEVKLLDVSNPKKLKDTLNQLLEETTTNNELVKQLITDTNLVATEALVVSERAEQVSGGAAETAQEALDHITEAVDKTNILETKVNGLNVGLEYTASTGILTVTLKDTEGNILSTVSQDLPLELLISSGTYNAETRKIELVLANGDKLIIDVADLIDIYLADEDTITLDGSTFKLKEEFKNTLVTQEQLTESINNAITTALQEAY